MPISEKDNQRLHELAKRHPKAFRGAIMPWYTEENWAKLRAAAVDGKELVDFETNQRLNTATFNDLVAKNQPVEKVLIDVDALISWCKTEGRPLDAAARNMYGVIAVIERDKQAGHA